MHSRHPAGYTELSQEGGLKSCSLLLQASNIELTSMTLGENIKARRKAAGLSQNKLARLAHINQSGLSKIERDANENVTIGTLRAIASVLRCSIGDLLPNEDKDVRYKVLADRIKAIESRLEHNKTA